MFVNWIPTNKDEVNSSFWILLEKQCIVSYFESGKKIQNLELPAQPIDEQTKYSDDIILLQPPSLEVNENGELSVLARGQELYMGLESKDDSISFLVPKHQSGNVKKFFPSGKPIVSEENKKFGNVYLYGKRANLSEVIDGTGKLRFTDINQYKHLENEKMRDDENFREFFRKSDELLSVQFGDISIPPSEIHSLSIGIRTRRCHCLCLSRACDSEALYKRFKADVCIEINADALVTMLEYILLSTGISIRAGEVKYFSINSGSHADNYEDAVFVKNDYFTEEQEFRVAVFYPFDEYSEISKASTKQKIFEHAKFIEFGRIDKDGVKPFIAAVFDRH